jgi:hypothetical protein
MVRIELVPGLSHWVGTVAKEEHGETMEKLLSAWVRSI